MFGGRSNDRVQDVAWPDSVVCLEFSVALEQKIGGVQWAAFLQELTFGGHFNHALGGGSWPSTLNWIIVSDDFDHSTVVITYFFFRVSNPGVNVLYVLSNFELLLLSEGGGAYSSVACLSHVTIDHASFSKEGRGAELLYSTRW